MLLASVAVFLLVFILGSDALAPMPHQQQQKQQLIVSTALGQVPLTVELANTPALRTRGLSGRQSLPEGEGMLFDFGNAERPGIWMKDMHFSLDLVWLDEEKTIIGFTPRVSPDTYPEVFYPPFPARYVLEVNAGWVDAHGIVGGDKVNW